MKYKEWLEKYHPELVDKTRQETGGPISFLARSSRQKDESRFTENITEMNNGQKDVIQFRNIEKSMNKSDIGKEYLKYLESNPTNIYLYYNVDVDEKLLGEYLSFDDEIKIYASNTKTVEKTADILIHELTHKRYNIGGDWHAEAVCKAQEYKHRLRRNKLTISELRGIIKETKEAYTEDYWKWRDRHE